MDYLNMQLREEKSHSNVGDESLQLYEQALASWTDDVPTCRYVNNIMSLSFLLPYIIEMSSFRNAILRHFLVSVGVNYYCGRGWRQ